MTGAEASLAGVGRLARSVQSNALTLLMPLTPLTPLTPLQGGCLRCWLRARGRAANQRHGGQCADPVSKRQQCRRAVLGGQALLDPTRLRERGVDLLRLKPTVAAANLGLPAGAVLGTARAATGAPQLLVVQSGDQLRSAAEVADLVVGVGNGRPVALRGVAEAQAGAAQPQRCVWFTPGAGGGWWYRRCFGDMADPLDAPL